MGGCAFPARPAEAGEFAKMKLTKFMSLALAATALAPLTPALAADYEPPIYVDQAPEYVPVEIGSGWYLRGDVAYTFKRSYKNSSFSLDDTLFDNNLIGLGWVGPFDIFSYSEKESPVSGSVGFGYHFNDFLRADVNVGLLANDRYSGSAHLVAGYLTPPSLVDSLNPDVTRFPDFGCLGSRTVTTSRVTTTLDADGNPVKSEPVTTIDNDTDWRRDCMVEASARNSAWNGMLNGYIDLGTFAGITPYVGAGIGALMTRTKVSASARCDNSSVSNTRNVGDPSSDTGMVTTQTTTTFNCRGGDNQTVEVGSLSHTDFHLLYGLSAGLSYQISQNTSLDVGYQYLNAPGIKYYAVSDDGVVQRKGMDAHQVKVGLRYDLW